MDKDISEKEIMTKIKLVLTTEFYLIKTTEKCWCQNQDFIPETQGYGKDLEKMADRVW